MSVRQRSTQRSYDYDYSAQSNDLLPWSAANQPMYYYPSVYPYPTEIFLPVGQYDDQTYYFDPSYYGPEMYDSMGYQPQDGSVYQEYSQPDDQTDQYTYYPYSPYVPYQPFVLPGPEQMMFFDPNILQDVLPSNGEEEEVPAPVMVEGTGEPHSTPAEAGDQPLHVMSTEGCGDAFETFVQPSIWGLQNTYYGPMVTNYGTVSVILRHFIRVDITVDKAVRVVNFPRQCTAAISSWGDKSCVCHPCGRVLQEGVTVNMATGNRLAKISSRGVTFTALNHGLVYLVDASGTKSTTERFQNLCYDLPMNVFYFNSVQGVDAFNDCFEVVNRARKRNTRSGDEIWIIAGIRIKQTPWGDVQVSRDSGRRVIWTSPTAGTISVTSPFIRMAIGCDPWKYFFVRMGQKRLSANIEGFIVRNGSQRAGFDSRGRLTLP